MLKVVKRKPLCVSNAEGSNEILSLNPGSYGKYGLGERILFCLIYHALSFLKALFGGVENQNK